MKNNIILATVSTVIVLLAIMVVFILGGWGRACSQCEEKIWTVPHQSINLNAADDYYCTDCWELFTYSA